MLVFALLLSTPVTADAVSVTAAVPESAANVLDRDSRAGGYCEILVGERPRVSCFTVDRGDGGVRIEGTAYARGSAFATWRSASVLADNGTSIAYRYTAEMGGSVVDGLSHIALPEPGGFAGGWYQTAGDARVRVVVRDRDALVDCLGGAPQDASRDALRRCASSSAP